MISLRNWSWLGAAALLVAGPRPLPASAQIIAVRAGQLVRPAEGTTANNQIILINGSTITAVGSNVPIPRGATVIDLSDRVVLPGMIDSHTHMMLTMDREAHGSYYVTTLVNSTTYRAIEGVANARSMLEHGITTIRDLGNSGNQGATDLARAIAAGVVPGPTMINSGRIIAPYGGQLQLQPERPALAEPEYFFADTREELIKAVRENIHYGATVIKIVVDDQPYIYSVDDIRLVVEEAGRAGRKVAAHSVTEQGFRNAAVAGVASIEHGFEASDEALRMAKNNGVVLIGTDLTPLAADMWEVAETFRQGLIDRIRRAYAIGVTMAFGSDVFYSRPDTSRGEVSLMHLDPYVEAGLPADFILKMITVNGAQLLGIADERGRIAPGFAADIIATSSNPLENISALKRVTFVMKDGVVYRGPG